MTNFDDTPTKIPSDTPRLTGRSAGTDRPVSAASTSKRATARRRMRAFAVAGGALVAAVTLAACNTSPYAASVNGHVFTVSALNNQLAEWTSNSTYVTQVDQANSKAQGGTGVGVFGTGGPGTYSSAFVANIVGYNVSFMALSERLAASNKLPGQDVLDAARAVNESQANYWSQFPASLRNFLVEDLAYEASLVPSNAKASALQSTFTKLKPYLFSQICLREASATTLAAAKKVAAGKFVGARSCYDQAGVETQSAAWQAAVIKLSRVGAVSAPIKTAYGYAVVQLASKTAISRSAGVDRVLSLLNAQSEPTQITAVVNSAQVKVNPAYGTWANGQVTPPAVPKG